MKILKIEKFSKDFNWKFSKNRKIENFEIRKIENYQLKSFEKKSIFKIFDFRFFENFPTSPIFFDQNFCDFFTDFFLNRCKISRCLRKVRREIARTQCRGVRERWVKVCFVPNSTRNDKNTCWGAPNWWICTLPESGWTDEYNHGRYVTISEVLHLVTLEWKCVLADQD